MSDKQIRDLMFIRRVCYTKHHVLSSQRKAVAANILEASTTPVGNVTKVAASAVQLEQQAEDEHDVILRVKWAIHCGVMLSIKLSYSAWGHVWSCHAIICFYACSLSPPCMMTTNMGQSTHNISVGRDA